MSQDADKIGQDEIENLLKQAQAAARPADAGVTAAASPVAAPAPAAASSSRADVATTAVVSEPAPISRSTANAAQSTLDDVQLLLAQAEQAIQSIDHPNASSMSGITPFELRDFSGTPASSDKATLDLLRDVELDLRIELGRTQMYLEDVLKLRKGSVVALDKLAGDPVDIFVNGRMIARGEILVLNDNFCVRVAELVAGDDL